MKRKQHQYLLITVLIWAIKISFRASAFSKPLTRPGLCFEKTNTKTVPVWYAMLLQDYFYTQLV